MIYFCCGRKARAVPRMHGCSSSRTSFAPNHTFNATPTERLQQHPLLFTMNRTDRMFLEWSLHLTRPSHPDHSTTLLACLVLQTPELKRWIRFTLSCERAQSLIRAAAAWHTKQEGIWEMTLYKLLPTTFVSHFITHNGNIYPPLTPTATCLYHNKETIILHKTVDRSVRRRTLSIHSKKEPTQDSASVANSSYNGYTKYSPKIYPYILNR